MTVSLSELLEGFPGPVDVSADAVVQVRKQKNDITTYVVLDDDPTGTQSVADLPVLTAWEVEDFALAFAEGKPAIYVMTNSRSLAPDDAERINREVVSAALEAANGIPMAFVSRSDSTLRGHFPLEPDTIAEEIEKVGNPVDGIVLVPAFGDAGRITVGGVHYAGNKKDGFVPVGESEFAKDATFGYKSSSLLEWVKEKTEGEVLASDVLVLTLDVLRTDQKAAVDLLRSAKNRQVIAVDIVEEEDLRLLALALIETESQGSQFIYRVGPPFARARIGQDIKAPVTAQEIADSRGDIDVADHGLVVIGSHVDLTTRQLNHLRETNAPQELELDVATIIDPVKRDAHVAEVAEQAAEGLNDGTVVVRTSRKLVTGTDGQSSLDISRQVSAAVVEVVQRILAANPPRFVIAKGGITSSDVATKGLGFRRATVVGPMLPGIVSLWSGQDGPAAGIPYVVFAGNVGGEESLTDVVNKLTNA